MAVDLTTRVMPHQQIAPVRKVDRKPDFRNEVKYKERERHNRSKNGQNHKSNSVDKKGSNLDLLL